MSRQSTIAHYTRILARWPKDALRPEKTFQATVLEPRLKSAPSGASRSEAAETNAAYLLLENSFSKQYPPMEKLMKPQSNPQHYEALQKELEELPNRSVFGNWLMRMKRMVRLK